MEAWTPARESVLPAGRKTRALLAVTALSAPRPVLRARVAEMLWSRRPEEQARASLRQEIHRLLEALAGVGSEVLVVIRDSLALRPGAVWVDVDEVMRATPQNPGALALLEGELLEELDGVDPAFDAWLAVERERVRDKARSVAEQLLREQAEPEMAIPAAQQLLSIDRAHEGAWRALMRAHAARGERGMAIQTYERCRAVLADLLDAQPSPETQKLAAEIRSGKESRTLETAQEPTRAEPRHAAPARGGPRIGVLPLQTLGTAEEESHLAQGLAEEITAALARFRWLPLVSSTALARLAAQTRDEAAFRRNFGLDYLLDGTVHRAGRRARLSLRLVDLRAGNQIVWTQRVEREADDLLALQDEIAAEVVAQLDPELLLIEARRAAARPPAEPSAYELLMRAIPLGDRLDRRSFFEAGKLLAAAIELEPDHAGAHAWYAGWHAFLVGQGWAENAQEALARAGRLAERAVMLDPQDARGLAIAGHVRAYLHHRLPEAIALHERAISLNPNLAMAWGLSGIAHAYKGDLAEAERRLARSRRLSPLDPYAFVYDNGRAIVSLLRRDHEAAVAIGREVIEMAPAFTAGCKPCLAALGHLGRQAEAEEMLNRLLALDPGFSVERFLAASPFAREEDRRHFAAGLRLAGVPERARQDAPQIAEA